MGVKKLEDYEEFENEILEDSEDSINEQIENGEIDAEEGLFKIGYLEE